MKLIYCNFRKKGSSEKGLEFNFSTQFKVKYDVIKKKMLIEETKPILPTDFYAENVETINLIVGENGIGKTTILNLIGLKRVDLNQNYDDYDWIRLYKLDEENKFGIETRGFEIGPLHIDSNRNEELRIGDYNPKEQIFENVETFDGTQDMNILYLPSSFKYKNMGPDSRKDNNRIYITSINYKDQIKFINDNFDSIANENKQRKIDYGIEINVGNESLFDIEIYNVQSKLRKLINNSYVSDADKCFK